MDAPRLGETSSLGGSPPLAAPCVAMCHHTLSCHADMRIFGQLLQAYVREHHPEADGVLPYILYSDETHVNQSGRKVHPVVVFLALPPHVMRRAGLSRYLAYLPSFTAKAVGLDKKRDAAECVPP